MPANGKNGRRYKGSKGVGPGANRGREYATNLSQKLKRHLDSIAQMHRLKTIPREHRRLPGHRVKDPAEYRVWMASQRIAYKILAELDRRYGKYTVRDWENARKDPERDFHEFVLQEAKDLVEDMPETAEIVKHWLKMQYASRTGVVKYTLSPIQRDANILYLIRCRRRFTTEDKEWVMRNLPF